MTTTNGDNCVGLMSGTLVRPLARYPASVVTDASLKIAANRIQATLRGNIGTGDTIITVGDASHIVPNMLFSIGSEVISVSSVSGNNLTVVRGFDGTQPACHASGSTLSAYITAWHHNALAEEIKAIEAALGPNLSNIPSGGGGGGGATNASTYDFQAQTPGGTLSPGLNVITLSPVPLGVNGTNQNHYLYISNGTGAPEAVLIGGGTATSGAASGTVIVTCANSHSGAWTIRTATAGGQEAYYAVNAGTGQIQIVYAAGTKYFQAPLTVSVGSVAIVGAGRTATSIVQETPNADIFRFWGEQSGNSIKDMQIAGAATSTTGYVLRLRNQAYFTATNLIFYRVANGVEIDNSAWVEIMSLYIAEVLGGNGIQIGPGVNNTILIDHFVTTSAAPFNASIRITECGDVLIRSCELINSNYGLELVPASGKVVTALSVLQTYFDHTNSHGLYMHPAPGGEIYKTRFNQCWFSVFGDGVRVDNSGGTVTGVSFIDCQFLDNGGHGAQLNAGSSYIFQGCRVANNGGGYGIIAGVKINRFIATGNLIGNGVDGFCIGVQQYGIYAGAGLGAGSRLDNTYDGNSVQSVFLPTGAFPGLWMSGCGYDDVSITKASAATIVIDPSWVPNVLITGTTTITTITSLAYPGKILKLFKSDAGSVTVGGGGNIPGVHTLAQNQCLTLTSTGGEWL